MLEEWDAVQLEKSMWLRKGDRNKIFEGHSVRKTGDKCSGDHVNWERIFSDYMEQGGGDSLTSIFGEEVKDKWPFAGQVVANRWQKSLGQ